ncbi:DUF4124 domain-containing protein [Candidatus Marimicrobium litorale]|uniref:DUF4124 domain-containing protein n=1 Tax=Candidatus Marimicrobium litorale TaxID=2518991 RepID=UPI00242C14B2|nr:DUF4124 domain-containing protein [Candidatus Marimicrobium litorale]
MKNSILHSVAVTTALIVLPVCADQSLYRWTDENGNQVTSDRPPSTQIEYEVISIQSNIVRASDNQGGVETERDGADANNEADVPPAPPSGTEVEQKKDAEYCQLARDNLVRLNTQARIRLRDPSGEIRFLNDEEKISQRKIAEDTIKDHCP